MRKKLVSGIKPTGTLHLGNYFGALKQFVDLQNEYDSNIFIADFHALTTIQEKEVLEKNIINIATDYLAAGIDPNKVNLFKQSDIPEVTQAAWIFNCITTMPFLMRAHSFKDAEAKDKEINVGVFDYPILMAADILLPSADVVPVGKDQKQHVEITRDIAEKFNRIYGETFKLPKPIILEETETVPGIDGRKMSKSYGNIIPLFATDEEIEKAVMSIRTDSKAPDEPKNPDEVIIYQIHKLILNEEEDKKIRGRYESGIGYKEAKDLLIKDLKSFIKPMREKREYWVNNPQKVKRILKKGAKKAKKEISKKMDEVRNKIGMNL
ncbi:tryptophan--tRNA ligase [Candidatus Parcubacteria bacterium]|nr:tryptophan--tRNA ligase [Candidatus Parcubacteria bacterium]